MIAARVDANQSALVELWRKVGAEVQPLHTVGKGCPDVLLSVPGLSITGNVDLVAIATYIRLHFPEATISQGVHIPVEIKASAKAKLTPHEEVWWEKRKHFCGEPVVIYDTEGALNIVGKGNKKWV